MKKILNVLTLKEPGGVQQREFMFRSYTKDLFEIRTVFLYKKLEGKDRDSICLYPKRPGLFQFPLIFFRLVKLILIYKPDIIMAWGWTVNGFSILASLVRPKCKRVVMQVSTAYEYKMLKGYSKLIGLVGMYLDRLLGNSGLYDLNIMVSEHNMKSFSHYPKKYLNKCKVIANGVNIEKSHQENKIFDQFKDKVLLGSVGRLSPIKNHCVIVKSLQYIPDVHYIIVGQGPLKKFLIDEALHYGVNKRLHIIDTLDHEHIYVFLNKLTIFMFPSLSEAFGLAVIEAASAGLPIVTINAPWVKDTLGPTFLTSVNNDPKDIAYCTKEILYNKDYLKKLQGISYQIAQKYDFKTMAYSYLKELNSLCLE